MNPNYYQGAITMWEIALFISIKLNKMLSYDEMDRRQITPEAILESGDSRNDLLFFYSKIC